MAGPACGVGVITLADGSRELVLKLISQFWGVREALPGLLMARQLSPRLRRARRGPGTLNLSTAAGHYGMAGWAAHSDFKWAAVGLPKTRAVELRPEGIRVNAILPAAAPGPWPPSAKGRPDSPLVGGLSGGLWSRGRLGLSRP